MDNRVRNRYNPEYWHNQAIRLIEGLPKEEALAWYNHPCTQSLRMALEGDLSGVVVVLIGGGYLDADNVSGTAQNVSKAIGMAEAINNMLEHIEEVKNLQLEDEQE